MGAKTALILGLTWLGAGFSARAADLAFTRVLVNGASPEDPWMKLAGDFTGDGLPDIAVCGAQGPLVLYAYPDWKQSTIASAATSESGSAAVDIDGDGDLDMVVGTKWYENPFAGGKPGSLPWASHLIGEGGTHDIVAGDLDKDGQLDIVMRGESTHDVDVFRQVSPTSWTRKVIPYTAGYNGLALQDIDKDGAIDIIVPGAWLENPGGDPVAGEWKPHAIGAWNDFAAIQAGDLDGDGLPDVVMTVSESPGKVSWFRAPANPVTGTWIEHVLDAGPVTNAHAVEIADMDRDGDPDIITSEYDGAGRILLYLNGGKAASWTRQALGSGKLHNIRLADIGLDGDMDILGVHAWGINPVELWRNDLPALALAGGIVRPKARGAHGWRRIDGRKIRGTAAIPLPDGPLRGTFHP